MTKGVLIIEGLLKSAYFQAVRATRKKHCPLTKDCSNVNGFLVLMYHHPALNHNYFTGAHIVPDPLERKAAK